MNIYLYFTIVSIYLDISLERPRNDAAQVVPHLTRTLNQIRTKRLYFVGAGCSFAFVTSIYNSRYDVILDSWKGTLLPHSFK